MTKKRRPKPKSPLKNSKARSQKSMDELWVIKAGSQMVINGGPLLIRHWMQQVVSLRTRHRIQVIWVTSGAIATARIKVKKHWSKMSEKQALSAIGQPLVMDAYNLALQTMGQTGAQILLTYHDIHDRVRARNLTASLSTLLKWDMVPVLNENDAVATEEIKFGDNDRLSAEVAKLMKADRLIMLTDVNGLYTGDPSRNVHAELVSELAQVTPLWLSRVKKSSGSLHGTGGIYSKLQAAQIANRKKITTHLLRGDQPEVLLRLASGDRLGTKIG